MSVAELSTWEYLRQRDWRHASIPWVAEGTWRRLTPSMAQGSFRCVFRAGRWLLQEPPGNLSIIGDAVRDLSPAAGGLRRTPAVGGAPEWSNRPSGLLMRPDANLRGYALGDEPTVMWGPAETSLLGRACFSVTLIAQGIGKTPYKLWIDKTTGVVLRFEHQSMVATVDTLASPGRLTSADQAALDLLDLIPDVAISKAPERRSKDGQGLARVIDEVLGGTVESRVLAIDDSGSFSVRITDSTGTYILDRRPAVNCDSYVRVQSRLSRWNSSLWTYSLDIPDNVSDDRAEDLARTLRLVSFP